MVKEKKLDLKEYNHIRIDWIKQSKRDNWVIKLKKKTQLWFSSDSWSFKIFPANIKHTCSSDVLNLSATTDFNYKMMKKFQFNK